MTLKFKRQSAGKYEATTKLGIISICESQGKWYIDFPDGKVSYRSSYKGAKAWAEKYSDRLIAEGYKTPKPKKETKQTLEQKLEPNNAYVCGQESIGCINSGMRACILHTVIDDKHYYLVGKDSDITDTLFNKNLAQIKYALTSGLFPEKHFHYKTIGEFVSDFDGNGTHEQWKCANGRIIDVFNNFKEAEQAYRALDQEMIDYNQKSLKEIESAKKKASLTSNDGIKAIFALSDYGLT